MDISNLEKLKAEKEEAEKAYRAAYFEHRINVIERIKKEIKDFDINEKEIFLDISEKKSIDKTLIEGFYYEAKENKILIHRRKVGRGRPRKELISHLQQIESAKFICGLTDELTDEEENLINETDFRNKYHLPSK